MKLGEKAEAGPRVDLVDDLYSSVYRLETDELVPADDVTAEGEFPMYGDFLKCHEFSPVDDTDRGEVYIQVPRALAKWLVENGVGPGDAFQLLEADKVDGEYQVDCKQVELPESSES